jgi:hypothetical protein
VTIMIRPSCGRETGEASASDLPDVTRGNIFAWGA